MTPENQPERSNRRGCFLMAALLALALLLFGLLATRTGDRQQANEATSAGP